MRTAHGELAPPDQEGTRETGERDKSAGWKLCTVRPALISAFIADTARGQAFARARLKTHPDHQDTLFFLGKMDLNYVAAVGHTRAQDRVG